MNPKLIAAGAGLFSFGVYVGWAVTQDRADVQIKAESDAFNKLLHHKN